MLLPIVIAAYVIGSLSFAVIVSRAFGLPDPHSYGSGNPGATNVLRTGRKLAALLTLLGDGGKGWLAVYLAARYAPQFDLGGELPLAMAAAALAVFIGHLYPVFFQFRGGKGVATALGILLAFHPWLGLAALATWLAVFGLTRVSSLSALTAGVLAPLYAWLLLDNRLSAMAILLMSALLLARHADNIRRLLSGQEGGFGRKPAGESGAKSA